MLSMDFWPALHLDNLKPRKELDAAQAKLRGAKEPWQISRSLEQALAKKRRAADQLQSQLESAKEKVEQGTCAAATQRRPGSLWPATTHISTGPSRNQ